MKIRLLADKSNYLSDIEEAKLNWLNELLVFLDVDIELLDNMDPGEQVEYLLTERKIEIITYPGISALRVDLEEETVGEWASPDFLLKTDKETRVKYYEITIDTWTIMDEEIDMD